MRMTLRFEAAAGDEFTESAARSLVGQRPAFNAREYDGGPITADYGHMVVVAAEVVDGGRALLATCATEGDELGLGSLPAMSIGPVEPRFEELLQQFMADNHETLRRLADGQP